jgi:hypothetical protein
VASPSEASTADERGAEQVASPALGEGKREGPCELQIGPPGGVSEARREEIEPAMPTPARARRVRACGRAALPNRRLRRLREGALRMDAHLARPNRARTETSPHGAPLSGNGRRPTEGRGRRVTARSGTRSRASVALPAVTTTPNSVNGRHSTVDGRGRRGVASMECGQSGHWPTSGEPQRAATSVRRHVWRQRYVAHLKCPKCRHDWQAPSGSTCLLGAQRSRNKTQLWAAEATFVSCGLVTHSPHTS